jgi:DinB family protein
MPEAAHLADALLGLFAHDHGWFTPFTRAAAGLSAAQAAWEPPDGGKSIWAIANHLGFWYDVVLHDLHGLALAGSGLDTAQDWPPPGAPTDEPAWDQAWRRVIALNSALAAGIAALADEDLDRPVRAGGAELWQIVQGLIGRSSYYTGEICCIRRRQGLWPPGEHDERSGG